MVCPECGGTGKKLVEQLVERGQGWNLEDCGCDWGYVYVAGEFEGIALESPLRRCPADQE